MHFTQINYDNNLDWHQWNRAAKQKIMIDNIEEQTESHPYDSKPTPKSQVPIMSPVPALTVATKASVIHLITPTESQPPSVPAAHTWDDLNLFGEVQDEMEYARVPIFQAQGPLHSHSFTDSEDDFSLPPTDQV